MDKRAIPAIVVVVQAPAPRVVPQGEAPRVHHAITRVDRDRRPRRRRRGGRGRPRHPGAPRRHAGLEVPAAQRQRVALAALAIEPHEARLPEPARRADRAPTVGGRLLPVLAPVETRREVGGSRGGRRRGLARRCVGRHRRLRRRARAHLAHRVAVLCDALAVLFAELATLHQKKGWKYE